VANEAYPGDGGRPATLFNTSTGFVERQRTPTWHGAINASAAGLTALRSPLAGKKFRLLGAHLVISPMATTGGGSIVELRDGAVTRIAAIGYLGAAINTRSGDGPIVMVGNGYLSAAADNVLYVNLTGGLTAGEIVVSVWGCDE
jgi:hypothetical protein